MGWRTGLSVFETTTIRPCLVGGEPALEIEGEYIFFHGEGFTAFKRAMQKAESMCREAYEPPLHPDVAADEIPF